MIKPALFLLALLFIFSCESSTTGGSDNEQEYTVSGIASTGESPIEGAKIELISQQKDTLSVNTDVNGFYEFDSVIDGIYILKGNKDKFVEFIDPFVTVEGESIEINPEFKLLSFPDSLISSIKVLNPDSLIGNFKFNSNSSSDFDMETDLGTDSSQFATMTFRMNRRIEAGDIIEVTAIGDVITGDNGVEYRALVGIQAFESLEEGTIGENYEFIYFFDRQETLRIVSPSGGEYINIYVGGTGPVNWDGRFLKLYSVVAN